VLLHRIVLLLQLQVADYDKKRRQFQAFLLQQINGSSS